MSRVLAITDTRIFQMLNFLPQALRDALIDALAATKDVRQQAA